MIKNKWGLDGIRNLICDLDDTLVECSPNYEACKKTFIDQAHIRTGHPKMRIRALLEAIDSTGGQLHHFTKERWPLSFAATSAALDVLNDVEVDRKATEHSYAIGNHVFECPYNVFPNIVDTLEKYHKAGFNLILYTKGDIGVQKKKLADSGLWKYFHGANTYIVNRKDGDAVRKIINEQYILPHETIVIGDNLREDIKSALDAKVRAVYISPHTPIHTMHQYALDHQSYFIINNFADLPIIIPPISTFANV